ncbi:MAG: hypothetical protein CVU64_22030 [Deltaproteobacteria bacterium HGW-Deltaproteobacteria-21]|nr:MAG: hypothetical protein CVU64_22030 [Deltaproteobacteria bacterium HGW-Deltaproteobacteria-21]
MTASVLWPRLERMVEQFLSLREGTVPMMDKRKIERFDLKVPARIEGLGRRKNRDILDLMTSDLCSGGAFFYTNQSLPEGTKVKVDLLLPLGGLKKLISEYDHAYIEVTGTVIRREPRGMAVCFNKNYSIHPRKGNEDTQRI